MHEARSLAWGNEPSLVTEIAALTRLLRDHPCFFDGAHIERLSPDDSHVLALARTSREGTDQCLVLINLDVEQSHELVLTKEAWEPLGDRPVDLLGQALPLCECPDPSLVRVRLAPGESFCLSAHASPRGLSGDTYRTRRAQAAWAYGLLGHALPHEALAAAPFTELGALVAKDPEAFVAALTSLSGHDTRRDLMAALAAAMARTAYPRVVVFRAEDASRITLVPPHHWILVRDPYPFEADLIGPDAPIRLRSIPVDDGHVAAIVPDAGVSERDMTLEIERFAQGAHPVRATLRRLAHEPSVPEGLHEGVVLLTNGRGGMVRMHADLGRIASKYDCLLGASLHPDTPSDRHVFVKRLRAWVNADGFMTTLAAGNLVSLEPGPPAVWRFAANGGDGRQVGVELMVEMPYEHNAVVLTFRRVTTGQIDLPPDQSVRLTLRFDIEDRSFHHETHVDDALEERFLKAVEPLDDGRGFVFNAAADRLLTVRAEGGEYFDGAEWSRGIPHPLDQERAVGSKGDAFSPGWFEASLESEGKVVLFVDADHGAAADDDRGGRISTIPPATGKRVSSAPSAALFENKLRTAAQAFLVRRGHGRSVIAGYPWFLDWGRDTLIAARGYLVAGLEEEVREIVRTYAGLERAGTLPNLLSADGAVSRETSDAPLWLGLVAEELASQVGDELYDMDVGAGRSLRDVLASIVAHHVGGAENGVRVDPDSGLVWSPPHFTWMDTNYPAATPREGYPIELSAMWIRLLRQLLRIGAKVRDVDLAELAGRAHASLEGFYREELGYCADTLHAPSGTRAADARPDDHLRPNQLLAITLGLLSGEPARSVCHAVERGLLIPGALRSLSPRAVSHALPVRGAQGALLNDPQHPYFGHYAGDEDTRRKPAYHNGTAWGWWLGAYCEALVAAYPGDPGALSAARAVLGSSARLMSQGCLGQLAEVYDGDAPHRERGCDAQAWSVTETLRVWLALGG